MRKEKIAPLGWKPNLPRTAEEIETTCACGQQKSPEFESCFECYELQKRHNDYLFDNCLYEYLPEPDNAEPIGKEYLIPMTSKTYNDYWQLLADYIEAQDVPIDWGFERDLLKLQNPKKLPYIAPENYYIEELKAKLTKIQKKKDKISMYETEIDKMANNFLKQAEYIK